MYPNSPEIAGRQRSETIVEVFKTNVHNRFDAEDILGDLSKLFPSSEITFDLEDCDRILRVVAPDSVAVLVPFVLKEKGFQCEPLHD